MLVVVAFLVGALVFATLGVAGTAPDRVAAAFLPDARAGSASTVFVSTSRPLPALAARLEVAALVGAAAAGAALLGFASRDVPRVRLRRGAPALSLSALAFAVGAGAAHRLLVAPLAGVVSGGGSLALDPYWLGELALFFPVAVGLGAALPPLTVGLVRARTLPRYTSDRQRGIAALPIVVFAAACSPPDLATFVIFAAPPLAGFAGGLAWCEFA